MKHGDYYPAKNDPDLNFARSYEPLREEEILIQTLKNGPYLFDDRYLFIRAMPWLMVQGILCIQPHENIRGSSLREHIEFKANHVKSLGTVEHPIDINYGYTGFTYMVPWIGKVKETLRRANLGQFRVT
jgi:hypothetical protein